MSGITATCRLQKGLLASLMVIAFLGLCAANASAQTGTLEGTVTDLATGLAIENARVMVWGNNGGWDHSGHHGGRIFTDENGFYSIDELAGGEYRVFCGARGYHRDEALATVVDDQTTVQDFALDPLVFGSVEGMVTDGDTGMPIAGAWVRLLPARTMSVEGVRTAGVVPSFTENAEGFGHWLNAVTGDDGRYLIENALAGEYEARASAFGYLANDPVPLTVIDGQTTTVDLSLDPLTFGSLEGAVIDGDTDLPIEGAHVRLRFSGGNGDNEGHGGHGGWGWHHTRTDADGLYFFEDLVATTYQVTVSAQGYLPASAEVEVLDGATAVLDFALDPMVFGSLEGTVTDVDTGGPIAGAWIALLPPWTEGFGGGGWRPVRTDDAGFYRFDNVAAGTHRVVAFAHGYVPADETAEVLEGQTTVVDLALDPR